MAGASISKFLLVFKHMGLSAYSARPFFFHERNFLFAVVINYWERYQADLLSKLKAMKDVVWSGDGRFDSSIYYTCVCIIQVTEMAFLFGFYSNRHSCFVVTCASWFFLLGLYCRHAHK